MSQAQVHTRPNFGEISSNIYEDIVFTPFFGSLPAVTLTFDLLTPKSNQLIYEPKYISDQNGVKFPSLV